MGLCSTAQATYITIPQRLGDQLVHLGMYTIDAEKVPILVGIKTLTKLGPVIDVSGRWMVLSNVSPEVKIPLARSKAGHLLVNLTQDWLNLSRPLQPEPTEGAYMVRSLDLGVEATGHEVDTINNMNGFGIYHNNMHMSEKPLLTAVGARRHVGDVWMIDDEGDEGEGQHDEDDELAFLMAPDNSHQPLPSATQEMRDKILRQLSSPTLPSTSSAACHVTQEGHDRGKGQSQTEGDSPRHREVRLGSDHRSRSPRPSYNGGTVPWRARDSSSRTWLQEWSEPSCTLGELRGVWLAPVLHSNMGVAWRHSPSWTTSTGHQGPDHREEARQEQHRLGGQEDQLRCPAAFF